VVDLKKYMMEKEADGTLPPEGDGLKRLEK
jgi:hypothetical protein